MKKIETKQWLPHVAAVLIFFILTAVYFSPVFQGKDLMQGDAISSQGWGKDARDYHEQTGDYAYWSNAMFSGMPSNYTFSPQPVNIFAAADKVLTLGMFGVSRRHIGAIFLTFVCFYIFLLSIGCRSWLSLAGSIAYTLCSYNFIIIGAGHMSKSLVMATMAPVIGGVMLCYRGKLLWGALVTLIFAGLNIYWSHQQISYYLLLVLIILAIVYLIYAIREKWLAQYLKATGVLIVVAVLAVLPAVGQLVPSADYAKETMRGGAVLKNADGKSGSGLDIDYAYQWSYGVGESFTLLVPNLYGAGSHYDLGTDSELYRTLAPQIGAGQARQIASSAPTYWGDQPFTEGPVYAGAIVCFLFVLGLFVVKGKDKWWLLAATVLSLVLSWGKNFLAVNEFLFYNLPLYSKFRAPSMALVIASVTMVALGIMAVKRIIECKKEGDKAAIDSLTKSLYIAGGVTGGICLVLALFGGGMFSFEGGSDAQLPEILTSALQEDRANMLTSDAWRSFAFIATAFALLFAYLRYNLKASHTAMILAVLFLADLWTVDKRFLSHDDFMPKRKSTEIRPTAEDLQILQDKHPNYRVLNLTKSTFNESFTSYFHKSVGGYSPAKMRRYQDIIDRYFGRSLNMNIINMLNVRYVIVPGEERNIVQRNPEAMGNCWLVDRVVWVNSPNDEIDALADFIPYEVAFIDKEWQSAVGDASAYDNYVDSTAYIRMTEYRNPGNILYESYSPNAQMAVFSEVFYKTWKAFIDGKEVKPIRANYILRALPLPAGKHTIEFRCVDELMITTAKWSLWGSILVGVVIAALVGAIIYRSTRKGE
ncbi:MAG: hypothetical protein IKV23_02460 [Bacteroidaceae bacterium]|nr:hypothetical protein [Bacteroidaceae bacterium]